MAKLYFRYGAMNSGKSTALMQVAHNYEEQGMRVLILKPQIDSKGGGELVSRLGVRRKADLLIRPTDDVFAAVEADREAHSIPLACVLCDESQFFTPAQAEQLFMEPGVRIFDVNTLELWAEGYIPGAVFFNVGNWKKLLPKDKNTLIVFYCANRLCSSSQIAAYETMKLGYTNVWQMPDGIYGWKLTGRQVELP